MRERQQLVGLAHEPTDAVRPLLPDELMDRQERCRHRPEAARGLQHKSLAHDAEVLDLAHAGLIRIHHLELRSPPIGHERGKDLDRVTEFLEGHTERVNGCRISRSDAFAQPHRTHKCGGKGSKQRSPGGLFGLRPGCYHCQGIRDTRDFLFHGAGLHRCDRRRRFPNQLALAEAQSSQEGLNYGEFRSQCLEVHQLDVQVAELIEAFEQTLELPPDIEGRSARQYCSHGIQRGNHSAGRHPQIMDGGLSAPAAVPPELREEFCPAAVKGSHQHGPDGEVRLNCRRGRVPSADDPFACTFSWHAAPRVRIGGLSSPRC